MTAPHPIASVLLVDDDPIVCEIARSYFEQSGAERIFVAHNGKDALDIVDGYHSALDFILLDLKMPVMDGVQFLRHMHERNYEGTIGIASGEGVAIQSLAMDLARKCGLNVIGPILKPFRPANLDALIFATGQLRPTKDGASTVVTASELEKGIDGRQIIAHYQPQVSAATRAVTGVEALARWDHPELGMIAPDNFIPLAEENGLIPALTQQMINTVISDMDRLNGENSHLSVSINLGSAILNDTSFPDTLACKVDESGQNRSRFILELTESKMIDDSVDSMEVMARLDLSGFELSLDDFGTQYSNIEQLTKYPFRELKIDRSFIQAASTDSRSRATVESCIRLGKQMGIRTVAEGIETSDDLNLLTGLGVDLLQGYLFAKPMPIDALVSWISSDPLQLAKVS